MLKRDFLEKQLEQLGLAITKLIAELFKLNTEGKQDLALSIIDKNLKSEFDLDLEKIIELKNDELIKMISENKKLKSGHLSLLADLLCSTAVLFVSKNETEITKNIYQKTLLIYEYINQNDKTFSLQRQEKINELKHKL